MLIHRHSVDLIFIYINMYIDNDVMSHLKGNINNWLQCSFFFFIFCLTYLDNRLLHQSWSKFNHEWFEFKSRRVLNVLRLFQKEEKLSLMSMSYVLYTDKLIVSIKIQKKKKNFQRKTIKPKVAWHFMQLRIWNSK